jgi:hypothetical protein
LDGRDEVQIVADALEGFLEGITQLRIRAVHKMMRTHTCQKMQVRKKRGEAGEGEEADRDAAQDAEGFLEGKGIIGALEDVADENM